MQEALAYFRQLDPKLKAVSDGELVDFIGETHPEFLKDPAFREEFTKRQTWREQGALDKLNLDVGRTARGAGSAVAGMAKGAGVISEFNNSAVAGMGAPPSPDAMRMVQQRAERTPQELQSDIQGNFMVRRGDALQAATDKAFPQVQPETVTRPIGGLAEGVGNMVPMLATGFAGVPTALASGAMMELSDAYEREIERQKTDGEPLNPDRAMAKAGSYAAVAGGIEAKFGAGRILGKIKDYFGKEAAEVAAKGGWKAFQQFAVDRSKDFGAGWLEEASQRLTQDLIVDGKWNLAAIVEEGFMGGGAQALTLGLAKGTGAAARKVGSMVPERRATAPAPQQEPAPAPPNLPVAMQELNARNAAAEPQIIPMDGQQGQPEAYTVEEAIKDLPGVMADLKTALEQNRLAQPEQRPAEQTDASRQVAAASLEIMEEAGLGQSPQAAKLRALAQPAISRTEQAPIAEPTPAGTPPATEQAESSSVPAVAEQPSIKVQDDQQAGGSLLELLQEGVTPANAQALLDGSKTPQQVVDEQLGYNPKTGNAETIIVLENEDGSRDIGFDPTAGPASDVPRFSGTMSHTDAIEAAREQGVQRIQHILRRKPEQPQAQQGSLSPEEQAIERQLLDEELGQMEPVQPKAASASDDLRGQSTTVPGGDTATIAPAAAPVKGKRVGKGVRARKVFDRETETTGPDVLSWLVDNGGLLSRSGAKKKMGGERYGRNKSMWDDAGPMANPRHNVIYSENGLTPDQAAQLAYNEGLISDPTPPALWAAIQESSQQRKGGGRQQQRESKAIQNEEEQYLDWEKATAEGGMEVAAERLDVGDVLDIEGTRVEVVAVDPHTGDVTLKDGSRFGVQKLPSGRTIWVEKLDDISEAEPAEQPAKTPTLRAMQNQGDLMVDQTEGFALTGEKATDFERIQIQKDREARDRAESEKGQADMFGQPTVTKGGLPIPAYMADLVEVVPDASHFPPEVRQDIEARKSQGEALDPDAIDGFYHNGKVMLNAAAFRGHPDKLRAKLVHEVMIHAGLRRALGDKAFRRLSRQIWWSLSDAERLEIETRNRIAMADHEQIGEEWLAYEAERVAAGGASDSVWARIAAAIRKFLRDLGVPMRLSDLEIARLVVMGDKAIRSRPQEAQSGGPRFSLSPEAKETLINYGAINPVRAKYKRVNWERMAELGETDDLREAGYIAPEGQLIDLSGKSEGGSGGMRSYDHREAGGTVGMQEIMAAGFIRINVPRGGGHSSVDLSAKPSRAQRDKLFELIVESEGNIALDLQDGIGAYDKGNEFYSQPKRTWSNEYDNADPDQILEDVSAFYSGRTPGVGGIRYSMTAKDADAPTLRAKNATVIGPTLFSITAYHGTPHKVDRFTTEKIGTGEGAQVYGWGLYFAENKAVAEEYQRSLAADRYAVSKEGGKIPSWIASLLDNQGVEGADRVIADFAERIESEKLAMGQKGDTDHAALERIKRAEEIIELMGRYKRGERFYRGNAYTVELDAEPDELLDLDKRPSNQSERVLRALRSMGISGGEVDTLYRQWLDAQEPEAASRELSRAGIKGFRYQDQGSRGGPSSSFWGTEELARKAAKPGDTVREMTGGFERWEVIHKPTYNYVIFDESVIKITAENGQPVGVREAVRLSVSNSSLTEGTISGQGEGMKSERPSEFPVDWDILKSVGTYSPPLARGRIIEFRVSNSKYEMHVLRMHPNLYNFTQMDEVETFALEFFDSTGDALKYIDFQLTESDKRFIPEYNPHAFGVAGTGRARTVFRAIESLIGQQANSTVDAGFLFSANEQSRIRLYEHLIRRAARPGWNAYVTANDQKARVFLIIKAQAADAAIAAARKTGVQFEQIDPATRESLADEYLPSKEEQETKRFSVSTETPPLVGFGTRDPQTRMALQKLHAQWAEAVAAKDWARVREVNGEMDKLINAPDPGDRVNVDFKRSPEETAEWVSATVDGLNQAIDEQSALKAAGKEIPADLKRLITDLQARLRMLKGWTEETPDGTETTPEPVSRYKLRNIESATDSRGKSFSEWFEEIKKALRYVAAPVPEIPLTGKVSQRAAPLLRMARLFNVETNRTRREAAEKINKVLETLTPFRTREQNSALKRYQKLGERRRKLMDRGQDAEAEAIAEEMTMLEKRHLDQDPFNLFRKVVLYRDLWWRGTYLKNEKGEAITLPEDLTAEEVAGELQRLTKLVEGHPQKDAINEALKRHYALVNELQLSIIDHGEIIPEALRNPLYFPHHILENWKGNPDKVRPTTEEDFRRYLIAPVGSGKLIQADYLKAMYVHTAEVLAHNAKVDLIHKYAEKYNIAPSLQESKPNDWDKPWNVPAGYRLFAPYKKIPLRMDYILSREVLAEKLGEAWNNGDLRKRLQEAGGTVELSPEDLHAAMVAGEKIKWVLPVEIADALDGMSRREAARSNPGIGQALGLPAEKLVSFWKRMKLFAPWNYIRYEYGNTLTDIIDKVLVADPKVGTYLQRAAKEIWDASKKGSTPTAEWKAAAREGVFDTITASEASELEKLPEFNAFLTKGEATLATARKVLGATVSVSRFRESVFRYAKFLADVERMKAGQEPVYAGAYHGDVNSLGAIRDEFGDTTTVMEGDDLMYAKAAEISLKTFGDYNSLGVVGQWLRKYAIPFWSWQDVNFRYHANQIRNIADGIRYGKGTERNVALKYAAVRTISTLTAVALAQELWNRVGGVLAGLWDEDDDLEANLSEADRRRPHLLLGRDEGGKVKVIYTPSAFGDVAEWAGGNNVKRLAAEYFKGDITLEQFISDTAKQLPRDTINKLMQSTTPVAKGGYELASGKAVFPDVLDQRAIAKSDRWWRLAGTLTDDRMVNAARSYMDRDYYGQPVGEQMQQIILQVRRRDPEQWSYYEARDRAASWKEEKTGKRFEAGDYQAPEAQVLRNFRRSAYRGDVDAAERFYLRLLDYGYTSERLDDSIRNAHPLADLTKVEQREYLGQLDARGKRELDLAMAYYGRFSKMDRREKQLFPRKGAKQFTPQPGKLRGMMGGE
jgi:hypothetical protein